MKKTAIVLSILVAANVLAARIDIEPNRKLEAVDSERKARVLRDARGTFALEDGSQWITHSVPAKGEPSAIGVTRFGPDGSARVFLVSDWLPKGAIPRGRCGQVFSVALLNDGRVAVSAGWNDGDSHNAVFVLRGLDDGRYATVKVIELPGVRQIAGGPGDTFVAVTSNASILGGGPMLTIIDTDGKILGGFFDGDPILNISRAVQNASAACLQRLGESRYALYDQSTEFIRVFDVGLEGTRANVATRTTIFIGDDPAGAELRVLGMKALADGDLLVARMGFIRGRAGTQLTIYDTNGGLKQSSVLEQPWNFMLQEHDRIRGVVMRDGVSLDTVNIRAAQ
jgi:hypothetical protein